MLNVETESTKINILSSQLLIFPCVSTDYMLVSNNFCVERDCLVYSNVNVRDLVIKIEALNCYGKLIIHGDLAHF